MIKKSNILYHLFHNNNSFNFSKQFYPNTGSPIINKRNILITAALPYVNNTPHLGNIIGAILSADTYARYCRMRGYNTLFICGTDEYGTTTEVKAIKEGTTPKEICDKYHALHKQIYNWFQIDFDYFGRTSNQIHSQITQQIFKQLHQRNFSEVRTIKQFYCQSCKISLADRYVLGTCKNCGSTSKGDQCDVCSTIFRDPIEQLIQPKCSVCLNSPTINESNHLYLKLKDCSESLKKWLIQQEGMKNWTNNAKGVTKAWLLNLQDRCITRNLNWGVPVPEQYLKGNKVFYVWFQAPIGYISITAQALGDKWKDWWIQKLDKKFNVQLNQFMGKDNIPFHSILSPATLQSTGINYIKPYRLSVTEYLVYEGGKFSKSNNIGVFGNDCKQTGIQSDVWRYFLLKNRPETYDTQFLWEDLSSVNKNDLMNTIGNMCLRIMKYTYSNLKNEIPLLKKQEFSQLQENVIKDFCDLVTKYCKYLEGAQIKSGAQAIVQIGQILNKYIQQSQFWNKKHLVSGRNKLIIGLSLHLIKYYALILEPYIPHTSSLILSTLSVHRKDLSFAEDQEPGKYVREKLSTPEGIEEENRALAGKLLKKPQIFFQDISEKQAKQMKEKFGWSTKQRKAKDSNQAGKESAKGKKKENRKTKNSENNK